MSGFKINGFSAEWQEWYAFKKVLTKVDRARAVSAMQDGELASDEMEDLFGRVDMSYGSSSFNILDIKRLFSDHFSAESSLKDAFNASRGWSSFLLGHSNIPSIRSFVNVSFLNERDFVLQVVSRNGSALRFMNEEYKNDLGVASTAVKNDPSALQYVASPDIVKKLTPQRSRWGNDNAKPVAWNGQTVDPEMILARLEKEPEAIKTAAPSLLDSKEFLLKAIKANVWALDEIRDRVKNDRELALAAVKENGWALRIFSDVIRNDKEIVMAAVSSTPRCYSVINESFKNDKDIGVAVVSSNGKSLEELSPELRANKDVVIAAVKNFYGALEYADDRLKMDPDVVIGANYNASYYRSIRGSRSKLLEEVKTDSSAFAIASDFLKNDIDFALSMAKNNMNVFRFMTKRQQTAYWNLFVEKYHEALVFFFTDAELASYGSFLEAIEKKYDIKFVRRLYGLDTLEEVLSNRNDPTFADDKRPKAVLIYNRDDWNGGFESTAMSTDLIAFGYQVLYYDVDNEKSMIAKLKDATGDGEAKADLLVIGGHGTVSSIDLGEESEDESYIDVDDFKSGDKFELARYVKDNGQVILDACSTGNGGAENPDNLANTIARTLPSGVTVQSATVDTSIKKMERLKGGGVKVTFYDGTNFKVTGQSVE